QGSGEGEVVDVSQAARSEVPSAAECTVQAVRKRHDDSLGIGHLRIRRERKLAAPRLSDAVKVDDQRYRLTADVGFGNVQHVAAGRVTDLQRNICMSGRQGSGETTWRWCA